MCIRISHKLTVTEEKIKQYALLSGDNNPIHLEQGEAASLGFQAPVAHGVLTMGLVMEVASDYMEKGMRISVYEMRFLKPVYQNETLEITTDAERVADGIQIRISGEQVRGKMTLVTF